MFRRFFLSLCLVPLLLASGIPAPASADDLSEGLELYRAKKYKEAVPYLERAANDGHEKAIEALDQIYESQNKGQVKGMNFADKAAAGSDAAKAGQDQMKAEADTKADDSRDTAEQPEKKENAKSSFWSKVIAIFFALGIAVIWFIHRTILRRKREQSQDQNPFR